MPDSRTCGIIARTTEGISAWNWYYLRPGHKIRMRDGAEAEVLSQTEDGEWIRVRYLDGVDGPLFVGTEDLADKDEVEALLGVVVEGS